MIFRYCLTALLSLSLLLPPPVVAFSIGEEKDLGEKLLSLVRQEFPLLDEPDLTQYINGLGREVLDAAGPQFFDYHFFIINNREFNAFAAPSGLVFIHSGLIETTASEDELFSVIAHECAHVASRHIAERMEKNKKISLGTAALLIAGVAMGGGALGEAIVTGSLAAGQTMNLHFSRKDEEEADRLAFTWMRQEHRNPVAMLTMLKKMQRIAKYRRGSVPAYLQTHPGPDRRVGYIQDLLYINRNARFPARSPFAFKRFTARIQALANDPAVLRTRYQRLEAQEPITAAYGLALAAMGQARYDEAITLLQKVRDRYPGQSILLADMGRVFFLARDLDKAEKLLDQAHRAAPDDLYSAWLLARVLEEKGLTDRAVAMYERLAARLPDYADIYNRLGRLKAAQQRTGESFYYMGKYYWLNGDAKKAIASLEKATAHLADGPLKTEAAALIDTIRRLEKKF